MSEKRIEPAYKKLIYICSPLSGEASDITEKTRLFCRFALEHGQVPIAPDLMLQQLIDFNDSRERKLAIFIRFLLLSKCSELWLLSETISEDMQPEIDTAMRYRIPVRLFDSGLREVMTL